MPQNPAESEVYFVGVDGGGTKCRAALVNASHELQGVGDSGPANPYQDFDRAIHSISEAIELAISSAGLNPNIKHELVVGLGLAGVNVPSIQAKVEQHAFPYASTFVTTDLEAANVAAHGSTEGAVVVIGTGTCGFAHVNGKSLSIGGHGFPMGDKGSGAWLGLSAIQAVLLADDGLGDKTLLKELLGEQLKTSGFGLVEKMQTAKQSEFASLAPLVFKAVDQKDLVAASIVIEGANYLSSLTQRLLDMQPPRISAIGGLAPRMLSWMDRKITARFEAPKLSPELGAAIFAHRRHSSPS